MQENLNISLPIRFLQKRLKMLKESAETTEGIEEIVVKDAVINVAAREPAHGNISVLSTSQLKPVSCESGLRVAFEPLPLESVPQGHTPSKNQELVGVLKHGPNGFSYSKKAGKRKISWQDEGTIKV
eukprot:c25190_g2_i1 orf=205-585(-)